MTCDELRPYYILFAMGVLDEPEKGELRAHLERGCETCTAGLREACDLACALGASADGPEPPRSLRRRILASAGAAPQPGWHWRTAWQSAAAVALVAVAVLVYAGRRSAAELAASAAETASFREEAARRAAEAAELRDSLNLLRAPETREVTFGAGKPAPARGRVFVNPSAGVLLIASNLPAPPAGKIYEMWIIPKGGKPAPAGLFASGADGSAVYLYRTTVTLATTGAIAVTLEAAGGVDAPTTQPVIVAAL